MQLSSIIAGLWRLPDWDLDAAALARWTRDVLELGVHTVDLADIYGRYTVEESFGAALRADPGLRDGLQLVTKCNIKLVSERRPAHSRHVYDSSAAHIVSSAENSLRVLGTDHLDVLLLHRQDPLMDPDEVARAFEDLRAAGKVRSFGASNFTPSHFDALQSRLGEPLVTNQVEASLLHLAPFEDGTLDQALTRRFRPMAWSPLAGGQLFSGGGEREGRVREALARVGEEVGAAPDAVAHAFLLRHPAGIRPITGSGRLERIAAAVAATELELSREQWFELWTASTGAPLP